jgi:hypothetical protein
MYNILSLRRIRSGTNVGSEPLTARSKAINVNSATQDVPRTSRMFITALRKVRYLCLEDYSTYVLLTVAWYRYGTCLSHHKNNFTVSILSSGFNAECLVVVSRTSEPNSRVTSLTQANQTLQDVF